MEAVQDNSELLGKEEIINALHLIYETYPETKVDINNLTLDELRKEHHRATVYSTYKSTMIEVGKKAWSAMKLKCLEGILIRMGHNEQEGLYKKTMETKPSTQKLTLLCDNLWQQYNVIAEINTISKDPFFASKIVPGTEFKDLDSFMEAVVPFNPDSEQWQYFASFVTPFMQNF